MVRFQTFQRYLKLINSPSFIKSSLSSEIPGTKTCLIQTGCFISDNLRANFKICVRFAC